MRIRLWGLTRGDSGEVRTITSGLSEDNASERGVLAMRRLEEGPADLGVICAAVAPDIFDEAGSGLSSGRNYRRRSPLVASSHLTCYYQLRVELKSDSTLVLKREPLILRSIVRVLI